MATSSPCVSRGTATTPPSSFSSATRTGSERSWHSRRAPLRGEPAAQPWAADILTASATWGDRPRWARTRYTSVPSRISTAQRVGRISSPMASRNMSRTRGRSNAGGQDPAELLEHRGPGPRRRSAMRSAGTTPSGPAGPAFAGPPPRGAGAGCRPAGAAAASRSRWVNAAGTRNPPPRLRPRRRPTATTRAAGLSSLARVTKHR